MTHPHSASDFLIRAQQEATSEILREFAPEEVATEVAENALEFSDRMILRVLSQSSRAEQPACSVYCTSCCHLHTTASVPEVILLAERLRLGIEPLAPLQAKLASHIAQTEGLRARERRHLRLPCPLLADGMCVVYDARPLVCRGWNSLEIKRCEADLAHPVSETEAYLNMNQYRAASQIAQGVANAIFNLGLDARPLDMVRGLAIALEVKDAALRWLAGDDLFLAAVNEHVFPPFSN